MAFSFRMSTKNVTVDEMNDLLDKAKKTKSIIFANPHDQYPDGTFPRVGLLNAYIEDNMRFFKLTMKIGKVKTFIFDKTGECDPELDNPGIEWRDLNRHYYKVPFRSAAFPNASPLLWVNPAFDRKRTFAYEYDMNDAYGSILCGKMPDTSAEPRDGIVQEGEIGFSFDGHIRRPGRYATFIFPMIDSPLAGYAKKMHALKDSAATPSEKLRWKHRVVDVIGYMGHERVAGDPCSRINPFIRNFIVESCNEKMMALIDGDSILCNTDAIVSAKPREDIPIGPDMGEFKIDHIGEIGVWGYNCQWGDEAPLYRGIPKKWFPKGWDIIKDEIPGDGNAWVFDRRKLKLVRNKEEANG